MEDNRDIEFEREIEDLEQKTNILLRTLIGEDDIANKMDEPELKYQFFKIMCVATEKMDAIYLKYGKPWGYRRKSSNEMSNL